MPTSSGNRLTPAYIAVTALPLVATREYGDDDRLIGADAFFTFEAALASVLGGLALLAVLRAVRGHNGREVVDDLVRRLGVFVSYLFIYDQLLSTPFMLGSEWRRVAMFALAGLGAFVIEVVLHVIFTGRIFGGRTRHGVAASVSDAPVFASLLATGALFGLSYEAIGEWAFAVAVLPYAFTAGAFRRLSQTKGTYEQTLVALAQIPEVGGHTPIGHAARTTTSPRPWPSASASPRRTTSGSTTRRSSTTSAASPSTSPAFSDKASPMSTWRDGAPRSSARPSTSKTLPPSSGVSTNPSVAPVRCPIPDLPLASRIIKVCSAYDESIHEMGFSPLEALERIHRGTVYDFDPDVVRELREVLERRGMLNHPATVTPG